MPARPGTRAEQPATGDLIGPIHFPDVAGLAARVLPQDVGMTIALEVARSDRSLPIRAFCHSGAPKRPSASGAEFDVAFGTEDNHLSFATQLRASGSRVKASQAQECATCQPGCSKRCHSRNGRLS